jgi:hypothetical protein
MSEPTHERRRFEVDPLADHPVGPDDLGNVVLHGVGLVARGWRWVGRRVHRLVGRGG